MFKIFSFGLGDIFNLNNLEKIGGFVQSVLDNIDINEFVEENDDNYNDKTYEENDNEKTEFIELKEYEDMYVLDIDLRGVYLRELSIRYDPGIIEINLNRAEIEKRGIGILANNIIVKKAYNRKFENIEDVDTSQILKSIDNGVLSIRMQKKYRLESIIDVDFYEDSVDN